MQSRNRAAIALLLAIALSTGCAAKRPLLYPNRAYQQAGPDGAEQAIEGCLEEARAYVGGGHAAAQAAGSTAVGSATGAAVGAASGAAWGGRAGRGAAAGAAGGATAGLLRGIFRARNPDPVIERYVGICLSQQGYQIIGWR